LRSAKYFRAGYLFASFLSWGLGASKGIASVLVDIIVGLDNIFEGAKSDQSRIALLDSLNSSIVNAGKYTSSVGISKDISLDYAMEHLLAAFTFHAGNELPIVKYEEWLGVWKKRVHEHNFQQTLQCSGNTGSHMPLSFDKSVDAYLRRFSCTNGLGILFIGLWPYCRKSLDIKSLLEITDTIEPLLRFAQDLAIDPEEILNMGLFVYSSVNSVSLEDARIALGNPKIRKDFQLSLSCYWRRYLFSATKRLIFTVLRSKGLQKISAARVSVLLIILSFLLTPVIYAKTH
jgi:hypothetical protein